MTKAERRALDALARATRRTEPAIASALVRGVRALMRDTPPELIERLLREGGVTALVSELFSDQRVGAALIEARTAVRDAIAATANSTIANAIPEAGVAVAFDYLSPNVITAIRRVEAVSIGQYARDVRGAVAQFVEAGLVEGVGPRTIARDLRAVVGLAPNQEQWVRDFRAALERIGTNKDALGYQLRDKRFDATLRRLRKDGGKLSAQQIDAMVDAYRRKAISYHAETIARTAAADAHRVGQQLAYQQAIDAGVMDASRLVKTWVTTMDGRERPEHAAANGTTVPFNALYPVDGGVEYPGQGVYNCRCSQMVRLLPRNQAAA